MSQHHPPPFSNVLARAAAAGVSGLLLLTLTSSPALVRAQPAGAAEPEPRVPSEAELGFPIYPNARFLTSYDAGRGQRYYLFGTDAGYEEMVRYYALVLDEGGDQVFDAPATHVFEVGRFREESMAFPPSVTIKDYTWNGSEGYLDPTPGSRERYATIIQMVPPPAGDTQR